MHMRQASASTVPRPPAAGTARWLDGPIAMLAVLLAAAVLLSLNAALRSVELDETYSLVLLSGHPRVDWPAGAFTWADAAPWFAGGSKLSAIAADLRQHDVHPPIWFYAMAAWLDLAGPGLFSARLFSILLTLVNLGLVAAIARRCGAPVAASCAMASASFAVLYTGSTVRMYPLALLFLLLGTWALLHAVGAARGGRVLAGAALAGVCFGLGAATHMLILFPCIALCGVAAAGLLARRRLTALAVLALAPLPFLAWAASFFLVQDRRDWQFPPFHFAQAVYRIAQNYAAAVFGGTPLYADGRYQLLLSALLALVLAAAVAAAATGARGMLRHAEGRVVLVGTALMPATLFLLGLAFDRQVSEPRYMVYSMPFLAIFLARGLRDQAVLPRRAAAGLFGCVFALQCAGAAALPFARATQQDARPTIREIAGTWQPGSLLLLPEAADTTGMTVTYVFEAGPDWPMHLVRRDEPADALLPLVAGRPRVFLVTFGDEVGTQAIAAARDILRRNGWRDTGARSGVVGKRGQIWEEYQCGTPGC